VELLCERLRQETDARFERFAVRFASQCGDHGVANPSRPRVGQEPFRPASGRDEHRSRARLVIPERHEKHHDPEVFRGITGPPGPAHFPFAPDLERHVSCFTPAQVAQRHDRDVTPGAIPHALHQRFQSLDDSRVQDPGEIVDVPPW
jgi:hypothetical protein